MKNFLLLFFFLVLCYGWYLIIKLYQHWLQIIAAQQHPAAYISGYGWAIAVLGTLVVSMQCIIVYRVYKHLRKS